MPFLLDFNEKTLFRKFAFGRQKKYGLFLKEFETDTCQIAPIIK